MTYIPKKNCPTCGSLIPETNVSCVDKQCEARNEKKRAYVRAYNEFLSKGEMPIATYQYQIGLLMILARRLKDEGIIFFEYCASWDCYELRKPAPKNPKFKQSRYCTHHAEVAKKNAEFMGKRFA